MKLTVIREDGAVYKDGISYAPLDMTGVPTDIHALQWKKTFGWIEFAESPDGFKQTNAPIAELPQWALDCIGLWDATKEAETRAVPSPTPIPTTIL